MQDSGLNRIQSAVISLYIVVILLHLAVIAKHLDLLGQTCVVGRNRSAFAACPKILPWVKAESSRAAHRSGFHPTIEFL